MKIAKTLLKGGLASVVACLFGAFVVGAIIGWNEYDPYDEYARQNGHS